MLLTKEEFDFLTKMNKQAIKRHREGKTKEEAIKILQELGYEKCVRCGGIGCSDCDKLGWKKKKEG